MGSCVSSAKTPRNPESLGSDTKTEKRLSLCSSLDKNREESVFSRTLVTAEDNGSGSKEKELNRLLSSSTYIVPHPIASYYQVHNSRHLAPIRKPDGAFFVDTMNPSRRMEDVFPGMSALPTSLQYVMKERLESTPGMDHAFPPKPVLQEKSGPTHTRGLLSNSHPLNYKVSFNDSVSHSGLDDIENADQLLSELKDLEKETQKRGNPVNRMERPKTRRGLCADSAEAANSKPYSLDIVNGLAPAQNKHPNPPHSSSTGFNQSAVCFNGGTVTSSENEPIKGKNLGCRGSKALVGEIQYNEAELRLISEIENEFSTN